MVNDNPNLINPVPNLPTVPHLERIGDRDQKKERQDRSRQAKHHRLPDTAQDTTDSNTSSAGRKPDDSGIDYCA